MARPLLALKVDVDTDRGTREGVPRLVELMRQESAGATFLFSLGPDHTGRAMKRVFRRGFLSKVSRTSVLEHYGLRTLLYGTLLPGPDIGRRHAALMRSVGEAGFETGIHTWDHVKWQDYVARRGEAWTETEMREAADRYLQIFGERPRTHGAAGWQMNTHAFRLTASLGYEYASDTRGTHPFIPVCDDAEIPCAQLPTTLPTLDELLGRDGITPANVHEHLLRLTRRAPAMGHVYTLHAELEGQKLRDAYRNLLRGWRDQGYALVRLADLARAALAAPLPRHAVIYREIEGRSGTLATQGPEVKAR
jgi:peptidoglycan/xylan/chitin deacetylase (PgdA/CDA1 family)